MAFPLAIAESVQVTAVLQMLKCKLLPRLLLSTVTPRLGTSTQGFLVKKSEIRTCKNEEYTSTLVHCTNPR